MMAVKYLRELVCRPIAQIPTVESGTPRAHCGALNKRNHCVTAYRPSVADSSGSFFSVAPPMCCSDIVWVVVSPCSSHAFGIPVVWYDIVVIRELLVADCAFPVLLYNLPVQELPHFRGRPQFAIAPRMMRIFNTLHSKSYPPGPVWD